MTVTVKYLASLAERLNKSEEIFDGELPADVQAIWDTLNPDVTMQANTLCAVNFSYVKPDDVVWDGSELAFFPPVTGG